PVEAEAVRHDDQEALLVDEAELEAEEAGVRAGLPPERGHRAEVVVAPDERDTDREAGLVRCRDEAGELGLLLGRELRVERDEDLLHEEVVAGRVAVGERRLREHACGECSGCERGALHVLTPAAAASFCTAAVADAMRPAVPCCSGTFASTA